MNFYNFFNENLNFFSNEFFFKNSFFLLILIFIFTLFIFFIKKKRKKKYTVYYEKIRDKKFWLSDLIKILLYSNQKGKFIHFYIIKSTNFYPIDSDFILSAPFDFNFLKAIIDGYDSENITIGIDFMNHIRFLKFKINEEEKYLDKSEIILYMPKNRKDFCIKYSEKEIFFLSPSSAINLTEKFLNEKS